MRSRLAALAFAGLIGLAGCGWHAGLRMPEGTDSVGVAVFFVDEVVLERDLEPLLHDHLTRAVSDMIDASLLSPDAADLVIRGRIYEYSRRGGIGGRDNELLETAVRIGVEARLEQRSTGRVLAVSQAQIPSGYVTADRDVVLDTLSVGGRPNEPAARDRALRFLADQIVLDLFRVQEPQVPQR